MSEVLQEHIGEVHEGKKPFQSETIHLILMRNIQYLTKVENGLIGRTYPSSAIGKKPFQSHSSVLNVVHNSISLTDSPFKEHI